MGTTGIEWTATQNPDGSWSPGKTWNPVVGCEKVSAGCKNCYAKSLHDQRHKAFHAGKKMPAQYAKPFEEVQLMPERLRDPLSWKKPQRVFVNSVSDLFHKDIPDEFIDRVFAVMALATQHTFQVLTKRADRMASYMQRLAKSIAPLETAARGMGYTFKFKSLEGEQCSYLAWPIRNVHLGVSVEHQAAAAARIPHLLATPAAVRFLSCEPLLSEVDLTRIRLPLAGESYMTRSALHATDGLSKGKETPGRDKRIDWCIVGCESGPGRRPMEQAWADSLVEQCRAAGVACFVKQAEVAGRVSGEVDEFPQQLRVRQYPSTGAA